MGSGLDLNVRLTTKKNSEQPELEFLNEPGNNKELSRVRPKSGAKEAILSF